MVGQTVNVIKGFAALCQTQTRSNVTLSQGHDFITYDDMNQKSENESLFGKNGSLNIPYEQLRSLYPKYTTSYM
jgi:hypothetical protein